MWMTHQKGQISDNHLEVIQKAPKPRTVREMLTFLGIAGYSLAWIEDYVSLTGPLRAMVKDSNSPKLHCNLTWTRKGLLAFQTITLRLQEAPAFALPDYSKKTSCCMFQPQLQANMLVGCFANPLVLG